jgi:hypothetical protein
MILMSTVMLVVWVCVLSGTALADEIVTVNYASVIGPVTYKGTGFLHGPTAQMSSSVTAPLKLQQFRTTARWVRQLYSRYKAIGITRIVSSMCDDFASGYICSGGPFPGDGGDWTSWETFVGSVYDQDQAAGATDVIYQPWNEPDASFPRSREQFFETYRRALTVLRNRNPNVKVAASTFEQYLDVSALHAFLDMIKANSCGTGFTNCYPTYFDWHELGTGSGADIVGHVDDAIAYMASIGISPTIPISITEYGPPSTLHFLSPGDAVRFLAKIERRTQITAANRACWPEGDGTGCDNLSGLIRAQDFSTRSLWWAYKFYADMTGNIVTLTPQAGGTLDGVASRATNGSSIILLGADYGAATQSSVTVQLTGLTGVTSMQVVVNYIQNQVGTAVTSIPQVQNTTIPITSGMGTITLPNVGGGDGYQVILTPASGGDTTAPAAPTALTVR